MALTCAVAGLSLSLSCDNPPVAGISDFAYIGNHEGVTFAETTGTITGLTLPASTNIYKWSGTDGFFNATSTLKDGIVKQYTHSVTAILPKDDQEALNEAGNLANSRVFIILPKFGNPTPTLRVYGRTSGLLNSAYEGDESNSERNGLPLLTFATAENQSEKLANQHFLDTDYTTSIATLDALLPA